MIANTRFGSIEGYESFKTECNFFKCDEEYPGWTGNEKCIRTCREIHPHAKRFLRGFPNTPDVNMCRSTPCVIPLRPTLSTTAWMSKPWQAP